MELKTPSILQYPLPGKWGMSFRSYGHGHKMQCLPYTSAKASASFLFPWALQMSPLRRTKYLKNIQGLDEQQILTKVVSVYLRMQGTAQ